MDSNIKITTRIYHFDLPLVSKLKVQNSVLYNRQGYILELLDDHGNAGYGEISPLPGLHEENMTDALEELQQIVKFIASLQHVPARSIRNILSAFTAEAYLKIPSVIFGVESALIDLLANAQKIPPYKLIDPLLDCRKILFNGLIMAEDNLSVQLSRMISEGYQAVKIKVGGMDLHSEIEILNPLRDIPETKISVRIDANRAWTLQDALEFSHSLPVKSIEYIEEPLKNPGQLKEFHEQSGMAVALDESLTELSGRQDIPSWCSAIIIKPALLGRLQTSLDLIKVARKLNIKTIISDTFSSAVGLIMHLNLSAVAGGEHVPMGLDTFRRFADNIIPLNDAISNGGFDILTMNERRHKLNFKNLKQIT